MKCAGEYRALFDLSGRVALVTGGTGFLGRYFVSALADFGASIAIVDQDEVAVSKMASQIASTYNVPALGFSADISNPNVVDSLVDEIELGLGKISILHNNAATKGRSLDAFFEPIESFSLEVWREIMSVNLDAMFLMAQSVGSRMARRGGGSIIQTSSIYGIVAPDQRIYEGSMYMGREINTPAVYSASKAGVIGLTRYLATYWANKGIRVNSITPGGVESGQNDVFRKSYSQRVPLGRMADPNEMTSALIFLASDASSYMTGQNLVVDGGLSIW